MGDSVSLPETVIRRLPPGSTLPVRNSPMTVVPDTEREPPKFYTEYALARLLRTADKLAAWIPDMSRYVEEYENDSFESALSETTVIVQPEFAPASELITEILVTGPVNTPFVLQLGDRYMSLSTDATGKCLLAPVSMKVGPNAQRILTAQPGAGTFAFTGANGTFTAAGGNQGLNLFVGQQYLTGFDINAGLAVAAGLATVTVSNVSGGPYVYSFEESTTAASGISIRYPGNGLLGSGGDPLVTVSAVASGASGTISLYGQNLVIPSGAGNWFLHLSGHALTSRRNM